MRLNPALQIPNTATQTDMQPDPETRLKLSLSARTLLRLLVQGQICAMDFRCLDCETHQWVRRLLKKSCARRLR